MKDITYCSPTRLRKRCATCYRRILFPNEMQSWSNFYDKCDDYYIKVVSAMEYSKTMDKIIDKKMDIDETLIALLNEAKELTIASDVTKGVTKRVTRNHIEDKLVKVNHISRVVKKVKSVQPNRTKRKKPKLHHADICNCYDCRNKAEYRFDEMEKISNVRIP